MYYEKIRYLFSYARKMDQLVSLFHFKLLRAELCSPIIPILGILVLVPQNWALFGNSIITHITN
jgi:hypothetical protein